MVAQYFADVTFWSSISRARWSFLEANVPVVVSLMITTYCSNQRSANEATSHGGSFGRWNVNQELVEVLRKHHVCSLSRNAESKVV